MPWQPILLLIVIALPVMYTRLTISSPYGYFAAFIGMMYIAKFFFNSVYSIPFLAGVSSEDILPVFVLISVYLGIGYVISGALLSRTAAPAKVADETIHFELTPICLSVGIVLPLALLTLGVARGINPVASPLQFRQFIQSNGMAYFLVPALFLANLLAIYIPYKYLRRREYPPFIGLAAYAVLFVFGVISGLASFVVIFFLAPLYFWSQCYKKRVEVAIVILFPVIVAYTLVYSFYRDVHFGGGDISVSDAFDRATRSRALERVFNRFDYLEMCTKGAEVADRPFPDLGLSILATAVQPIPRSLWPDKPNTFSTTMTRIVLPSNYEIGVTANFNSMNEFSWAFGKYFGLIIGGVFLGLVLFVAQNYSMMAAGNSYRSVFYTTVIFPYVTLGFVAGFFNDLPLPMLIIDIMLFRVFVRPVLLEPAPEPLNPGMALEYEQLCLR